MSVVGTLSRDMLQLDLAGFSQSIGSLAGALVALSHARSLEGAEAVWRTASFDRVRMRLN